jgi:hypothetical protein
MLICCLNDILICLNHASLLPIIISNICGHNNIVTKEILSCLRYAKFGEVVGKFGAIESGCVDDLLGIKVSEWLYRTSILLKILYVRPSLWREAPKFFDARQIRGGVGIGRI